MFLRKKEKQHTLDMKRIPQHIGIIMDGNGRWARRRGLPRTAGHKKGADNLEHIADYCASLGVKALTVYAFSTENWARPQDEVDTLMQLMYDYLLTVEKKFAGRDMRLKISGDRSRFSDKINHAIDHAEEVTASGNGMVLNIALNYGGRDEIVHAAKMVAERVKNGTCCPEEIDETYFAQFLYTADLPEVDLIIRPSGEQRLSNFLLWQAAYAEFWYSDICWPDFKDRNMRQAILAYQRRDRRFGGVK